MDTERTPSAVDKYAETFFHRLVEQSPETATGLGLDIRQDEYSDYSPAGQAAGLDLLTSTYRGLADLEPVDATDEVTLHAMKERLSVSIELASDARTELNNIASAPQSIRQVFELMPQNTDADFKLIAARLHRVGPALAGFTESIQNSITAGSPPSARQVSAVIGQAQSWSAPDGALRALSGAATAAGVSEEVHSQLTKGLDVACERFAEFSQTLHETVLDAASPEDAAGAEHYHRCLRYFTGADLDLEETYAWGLDVLTEIVEAQRELAASIVPGGGVEAAKAALNADPQRTLHGTEALQNWMQQLSDTAVRDLAGTHFDIPAPMDRLQCMIAPTQDGGVYYTPPSEDFSRPGQMWWSVPPGDTEFTTWAETTTVYHEGVPGHHLQLATAIAQKSTLNSWRRHCANTSGFAEGWALYAEQLMTELGYLEEPGDKMGMLDMQRMRAARVVFDIGVHCGFTAPDAFGGKVWDPATGKEFLRAHLPISAAQLDFEFTRYLGWPGQAPSYKVGQRVIEDIRAQAQKQQGTDFSARAFHSQLLNLGGVGLDTLRFAMT